MKIKDIHNLVGHGCELEFYADMDLDRFVVHVRRHVSLPAAGGEKYEVQELMGFGSKLESAWRRVRHQMKTKGWPM